MTERAKQQKRWEKKNPEYHKTWAKSFSGYFKLKYSWIKVRCERKGRYYGLPFMSKWDWEAFLTDTLEIRAALHCAWVDSGYNRRMTPTIDRIDSKRGYVMGNCRWITQSENSRLGGQVKGYKWRQK